MDIRTALGVLFLRIINLSVSPVSMELSVAAVCLARFVEDKNNNVWAFEPTPELVDHLNKKFENVRKFENTEIELKSTH
jgi:phospholipid N-methyltransferase